SDRPLRGSQRHRPTRWTSWNKSARARLGEDADFGPSSSLSADRPGVRAGQRERTTFHIIRAQHFSREGFMFIARGRTSVLAVAVTALVGCVAEQAGPTDVITLPLFAKGGNG